MKLRTIKYFLWTILNIKSLKNWKNRNFSTPSPDFIKHQVLIKNNFSWEIEHDISICKKNENISSY